MPLTLGAGYNKERVRLIPNFVCNGSDAEMVLPRRLRNHSAIIGIRTKQAGPTRTVFITAAEVDIVFRTRVFLQRVIMYAVSITFTFTGTLFFVAVVSNVF